VYQPRSSPIRASVERGTRIDRWTKSASSVGNRRCRDANWRTVRSARVLAIRSIPHGGRPRRRWRPGRPRGRARVRPPGRGVHESGSVPGGLACRLLRSGAERPKAVRRATIDADGSEQSCIEYVDRTWRGPRGEEEIPAELASHHSLVLFSSVTKLRIEEVPRATTCGTCSIGCSFRASRNGRSRIREGTAPYRRRRRRDRHGQRRVRRGSPDGTLFRHDHGTGRERRESAVSRPRVHYRRAPGPRFRSREAAGGPVNAPIRAPARRSIHRRDRETDTTARRTRPTSHRPLIADSDGAESSATGRGAVARGRPRRSIHCRSR